MTTKKQWSSGTGEVTINYNGSGNGQITISSDDNNLYDERSMQIVVQTTAGSPQQTKTVNISQEARVRTDISNAVVTAANQTYSGSALTPSPTVKLNGVTIPSTGYDVTYSDNTNAGTATVTVTGKGEYMGTASGTFTIAKANPVYVAPVAQSLTYSGSSQYLTTSGSTSHGTIQYSADGTNWYTTRRTKTNAGSYTTYWRLVGDANHNDVASTSINVTIAQKALTITARSQTITYGGNIATGTSQVTTSGLVSSDSLTAVTLTASTSSVTTSGTITPSAATTSKGISNYSVTYNTGNLTINKANSSVTSAPTAKSLTYSRSAQSLINAGSASGGTLYYKYTTTNSKPTSTSGFSSSIPTRTNAGTYYVWYYVKGDSNHNDTAISSTAVTVTIAKVTPVVATAPSKRTGLSYTGSAQNLLSGGSMKHSSSDSASVSGTFTYKQGTNAGSYSSLTWSFAPTDSTNYNSASGTVSGSVSIAKASRTITFTKAPTPLDIGETGTLAASVSAGGSDGSITFSSSSSSKASVSGTTITGVANGTAIITAKITGGTNYADATTTYTVTVAYLDYVDLGLPSGKLWAKCNVDVTKQSGFAEHNYDRGSYFSWGNTDGHNTTTVDYVFDVDNYAATPGSAIEEEIPISNDAANYNCGSTWRIPSISEFNELCSDNNTTKTITTINNVAGLLFTSKKNGKTIFMPQSGVYAGSTLQLQNTLRYLERDYSNQTNGYHLFCNTESGTSSINPYYQLHRINGLVIRAVRTP